MLRVRIYLIATLEAFCLLGTLFSQQHDPVEAKEARATLDVISEPGDSSVTITFMLKDSAHVTINVYDRVGEVYACPVFASHAPGTYSASFDKRFLPEGKYAMEMWLDHKRPYPFPPHLRSGFVRLPHNSDFTNSQAEVDLMNKAIQLFYVYPQKSARLFDSLLAYYPHNLNRGAIFSYALMAYLGVQDKQGTHAIVDSMLNYLPTSHSYRFIATFFAHRKFDLPFAVMCAKKAMELSDDVPIPWRPSYRFNNIRVLADVYLASGDDENAEKTLREALSAFETLPEWDEWVIYRSDVSILTNLGIIKERQGQTLAALDLYLRALKREPNSLDLWTRIQHAYVTLRQSEEGYFAYRGQILSSRLGLPDTLARRDSVLGAAIPKFHLKALAGRELQPAGLRGKVTLLFYWEAWSPSCLDLRNDLTRLHRQLRGKPFQIVAVHGQPQPLLEQDQLEVIHNLIDKYPTPFDTFIDDELSSLGTKLGINVLPTCIVVDKKGTVRHKELGFEKGSTVRALRAVIDQLLNE